MTFIISKKNPLKRRILISNLFFMETNFFLWRRMEQSNSKLSKEVKVKVCIFTYIFLKKLKL